MSTRRTPVQTASSEGYAHRVLVALDQFVNVILGGLPDETVSSRCARAKARGAWWGRAMIWWLDKIQPHHGWHAERADLGRAEIAEETERRAL